MNNASIFVVIVMYSSRNSSSRPLYSVVNSVVHPMIHCTVCMKLVGLFSYSLLRPFWTRWQSAIKMQVAHDVQVVKHKNKNQQFSLYFRRFEKAFLRKKVVKILVDFGFWLAGRWGTAKNEKLHAENTKKCHILKIAKKIIPKYRIFMVSGFKNGKILYDILALYLHSVWKVAC